MAYTPYTISSIADIPASVALFAAGLGFTTTTPSAGVATVKHPTYVDAKTFTLTASSTGSAATLVEEIVLSTDAASSTTAVARSPKLNPTVVNAPAAVVVPAPTKLHLFGELGGSGIDPGRSWIAGVIEYGFNLYRHFYLGYVQKVSSFTGGEIITGSTQRCDNVNQSAEGPRRFDNAQNSVFPFSCRGYLQAQSNGGVLVNHAEQATPWCKFANMSPASTADFDHEFSLNPDAVVVGGYLDSVNSGYMNAAKSPYSGAQILVPVNLYLGKRVAGTQYFRHIGHPPGVRLVHMEDLEPEQQVTIGSSTWIVFPVFSKRSDAAMNHTTILAASNRFPAYNTSHLVGMAYQVSP